MNRTIGQAVFRAAEEFASPLCRPELMEAARKLVSEIGPISPDHDVIILAHLKAGTVIARCRGDVAHCIFPGNYYRLVNDPFWFADRFPTPLLNLSSLPDLEVPDELPPVRTLADVQAILKSDNGATLLGAAQAIVDGGSIVFIRDQPDTAVVRDLWAILPTSVRCEIDLATMSPNRAFRIVVAPAADLPVFQHHVRDSQAAEYPEGKYELNLQIAAETDDQAEIDRLFARRSHKQTLRLAMTFLVFAAGASVLMRLLGGR